MIFNEPGLPTGDLAFCSRASACGHVRSDVGFTDRQWARFIGRTCAQATAQTTYGLRRHMVAALNVARV
jgi:hypothetical protein